MKKLFIAAFVAAIGTTAYVQPAAACSPGYEKVKIQGHYLCKIKTPKLPLKAKS